MVGTRDLPELPPEWAMDLLEESEFIRGELARLTEAINGLVVADTLLQKEIEKLKRYDDLVWEKVIMKYHPDAKLVEMITIATSSVADQISKNLGNLHVVSNNLITVKNKAAEFKAKIKARR